MDWSQVVDRFNNRRDQRDLHEVHEVHEGREGNMIVVQAAPERGIERVLVQLQPTATLEVSQALGFLGRQIRECLAKGQTVEISLSVVAERPGAYRTNDACPS